MPLLLPPWPPQLPEIAESVQACLQSGDWGRYQSETKDKLTELLRQTFQVDHVRLCCSGSAAVETALRAVGVGTTDEVIVCAYDYPGNLRAIELLGARPVLVDLAENNFGPRFDSVLQVQGERVRALIASHLYGRISDMQTLRDLCDQRGWILIEDACQTPGMRVGDSTVGSFGHLATLSFGGSKPLTAGSGGAILTSDDRLNARLSSLIDRPSEVFPLSSLQASVLLPQLLRLRQDNQRRSSNAILIAQAMRELGSQSACLVETTEGVEPTYYKLAFLTSSPAQLTIVLNHAITSGLPLGSGFRSMHRVSERRCRKVLPLQRASDCAGRLCLLDQNALLIEPSQIPLLAKLLVAHGL